ncbi:hypothetical protein [Streptomyces cucumeris]|uniref:hypothetical protein n=1 Tax=Streptomyces cucumeris TaxID=2962890 RepID=UPI0020C8F0AB|nr:hypothetical protein [Streptomyces sp. NEAU-Y11]MCP9209556.1 hypothetical protein [Streptomyces sp. NEAU-Y11]
MIINTRTVCDDDTAEPLLVLAVIKAGGAGCREVPIGPADDIPTLHADIARELADRPLRRIEKTLSGFRFEV